MRSRVLIAGAGVAGLEAALALTRLAPGLVDVELLDPGSEFVYRPLLVAEPFGVEASLRFDLDALVAHTGATRRHDGLAAVDGERRRVQTAAGVELPYDSLLVAPGAHPTEGIPKTITITDEEVREALSDSVSTIINAVRVALERTPPELSADIVERGIVLTGGGALLKNLDKRLMIETGLPVVIADDPLSSVVLGTGKMLSDFELLKRVKWDNSLMTGS